MYIANFLTLIESGVFVRTEQNKESNNVYNINNELIETVKNILIADKAHYDNMFPKVNELMPGIIGKYKKVVAIGGGNPKFETTILRAENIKVVDMNCELYRKTENDFREICSVPDSVKISYINQIISNPFTAKYCDAVTFVHFLEHMENFEVVKEWISCQQKDIIIYMPCIEAANDENWWHYNYQHNVFFTVEAICQVGVNAGYTCNSMRYSDDMLIWMKR